MNTRAPELSALMIILRSTGPVISTRRVLQVVRRRRHRPVAVADSARLGEEVGARAAQRGPALPAARRTLAAARLEAPRQLRDER
jgi:hypothetical protein